jgi:NAD-dependent SIR2 family protein deacetylase
MLPISDVRCNLCGQQETDNNRKTARGYRPDKCPNCGKTLPEDFDLLWFNNYFSSQKFCNSIFQSQAQATSLGAVSRIVYLTYNTIVTSVTSIAFMISTVRQKLQNKLKHSSIGVVLRKLKPGMK